MASMLLVYYISLFREFDRVLPLVNVLICRNGRIRGQILLRGLECNTLKLNHIYNPNMVCTMDDRRP
jgi:hypothetical protein